MSIRPKARALVAVAAAYAVVLQAALSAIGAPQAGYAGFAAAPLCSHLNGAHEPFAPAGGGSCCFAACLGCCCGTSIMPAAPAIWYRRMPAQRIAAQGMIVPVLPSRVAAAHRSRAPPLA